MEKQSGFKKFIIASLGIHLVFFIISFAKVTFLPKKTITIEPTMRVDVIALPDKIEKLPPAQKPEEKKVEKKPPKKIKEQPKPKKDPAKKPEKIAEKTPDKKAPTPKKNEVPDKEKPQDSAEKKPEDKNVSEPDTNPVPVIKGNVLSKGTQLEGLVKLDFDDYFDTITRAVNSNWNLPEWLSEEDLRATVIIKVNPDGSIASKTIKESSGNDIFDNSVLKAFDTIGRLPEPPERIKSLINAYGISLGFPE